MPNRHLHCTLPRRRVRDGDGHFRPERLGLDALLASTCLPQIFAPICIDGEYYWDGGWAGNPALEPLLSVERAGTILCVLVQTLKHLEVPKSPEQIATRMGELGFTSSFLRELRSLIQLRETLGPSAAAGWETQLRELEIALIEPGEPLQNFKNGIGGATRSLISLARHGRHCADAGLADPQRHRQPRCGDLHASRNDNPPADGGWSRTVARAVSADFFQRLLCRGGLLYRRSGGRLVCSGAVTRLGGTALLSAWRAHVAVTANTIWPCGS